MAATLTDAGTCRHCGWALRHTTLLDDNDQPVDHYLGANPDHSGALDALCPGGAQRDCKDCNGTGGEDGDPDAEWDCQTCLGAGRVADHQPVADLATLTQAIGLVAIDYRNAEDPTATDREAVDALVNGGLVTNDQVARWNADKTIDDQTADAYRQVLAATLDDLDAALRDPRG